MNSVKLCITSRRNLSNKYAAADIKKIDTVVKKWIAADNKRGINTVLVAVDDAASMAPHGVAPIAGTVTAAKAKRVIDKLWKKLQPDYLVILGAQDIIPYFEVPNPSKNKDDTDVLVPTDNPYACDKAFDINVRASYLVPSRVYGRIPDMVGDGDPAWITSYLARATSYQAQSASYFADNYAVCCDEWAEAGRKSMAHFGASPGMLMISPPVKDGTKSAQKRLASRLHMIKCHGAELDPRFFGQAGDDFPPVLESATLKSKLTNNTLAAAVCCYGAQIYSPSDARATQKGDWPLASTYLRNGALGFAGSTMIAWVGSSEMMCADWIVAGFLKSALGGASLGRALLDSKLGYLQWLDQQGQTPDLPDEKTMLEFVLLGDPSLHPVISGVAPGITAGAAVAAMFTSPLAAGERRQRRIVRTQMAANISGTLPVRTPVRIAASALLDRLTATAARIANAKNGHIKFGSVLPIVQKVTRPAKMAPQQPVAAMRVAGAPMSTESYQYYWSDKGEEKDGIKRIRLVKMETDANGMLLRSRVLHSS